MPQVPRPVPSTRLARGQTPPPPSGGPLTPYQAFWGTCPQPHLPRSEFSISDTPPQPWGPKVPNSWVLLISRKNARRDRKLVLLTHRPRRSNPGNLSLSHGCGPAWYPFLLRPSPGQVLASPLQLQTNPLLTAPPGQSCWGSALSRLQI